MDDTTTAPPPAQATTAAPVQATTAAPVQTTTAPPVQVTTAAPVQTTTAPPVQVTTAAPVQTTTAPPVQTTTAAPVQTTTRPPTTTTAPPATTTRPPTTTTAPPATTTTAPPATTTRPPTTTTAPPATTTRPPTTTTAPPATTTRPPTTTTAPHATTTAPAGTTTAPPTTTTRPAAAPTLSSDLQGDAIVGTDFKLSWSIANYSEHMAVRLSVDGDVDGHGNGPFTMSSTDADGNGSTTISPTNAGSFKYTLTVHSVSDVASDPLAINVKGGGSVTFQGKVKDDAGAASDSFNAAAGAQVVLSWSIGGADKAVLTDPAGQSSEFDSSTTETTVTIGSQTGDYTLVAKTGDHSSDPAKVHVAVVASGTNYSPHMKVMTPDQQPVIDSFTAYEKGGDPSSAADDIEAHAGGSVVLCWEVAGNISGISIDQGVNDVTSQTDSNQDDQSGQGKVEAAFNPDDGVDQIVFTLTIQPAGASFSAQTKQVTVRRGAPPDQVGILGLDSNRK